MTTLDRRRFLGAAAAAPFVLSRSAAGSAIDDEIRVGLVGCGGRGTGAAAQALQAPGRQVLAAVADVFPDKIERCLAGLSAHFGDRFHELVHVEDRRFTGFDAYRRLLESDVDVVLLATPPHFRPEMFEAAVERGKHVFTEKPMAVDAPGCRRVLAAAKRAREAGLSVVSGFCWRYNVRHRAFYEQILGGRLGDLRAIYSTYLANPLGTHPRRPEWSEMEFQLRNWQHFLWLSGDHVVEQAVHSLDKQSWAMGDRPPIAVVAVGGRQARFGEERGNVYDHFSATFEYEGGVKAFHVCRQMANCFFDNTDELWGSEGRAYLNGWANDLRIETADPWRWEGEGNDMYQQEHDELFASVRGTGPYKNDGDWMVLSTLLAIMVRMAAYTGRRVTYEEALASQDRLGPERYAFGDVEIRPVAVPGVTQFS